MCGTVDSFLSCALDMVGKRSGLVETKVGAKRDLECRAVLTEEI